MENTNNFKIIGYFEDYFVDNKYIGSKKCAKQPDRRQGFLVKNIFTQSMI